jgi:hypothetical protein
MDGYKLMHLRWCARNGGHQKNSLMVVVNQRADRRLPGVNTLALPAEISDLLGDLRKRLIPLRLRYFY